jgi:hypothetical protein
LLQVDQNNLGILDQEEDVHVLKGSLKLFFRELKKPLIPFEHFSKALRASSKYFFMLHIHYFTLSVVGFQLGAWIL